MCLQEEKLDRTEEFLRAVVFRPSTQRLSVIVDSLSVGLVDDRYGHHINVIAARLQVESPLPTPLGSVVCSAGDGFAYLNWQAWHTSLGMAWKNEGCRRKGE